MDEPDKCPLCLHPDSTRGPSDNLRAWAFSCPRCGKYYMSELLYKNNLFQFKNEYFKLACVANEWHLTHERSLFVLTDEWSFPVSPYTMFPNCTVFMIDDMLAMFPTPTEIIDRTLLNLSCLVKQHPMDCITIQGKDMPFLSFCPDNVLRGPLHYLKNLGLIEDLGSSCSEDLITITPAGWQRIQELSKTTCESKQAFVAMWFTDQMNALYKDAIEPAITNAGFKAKKIDLVEHNNEITDEIIAEIRKSRFVVADFTAGYCAKCDDCENSGKCEDKMRPRGGVYYEAGFAKGLGLEVIWMVNKNQLKHVHFDIRQRNFIDYADAKDLEARLYNRIVATI